MRDRTSLVAITLTVFLGGTTNVSAQETNTWRHWRGPLGTGHAPEANPPLTWSEERNVRWKVPLPGLGHASPVLAGERLLLTSAEPFGPPEPPRDTPAPGAHDNARVTRPVRSLALAFDARTGERLWTRTLHEGFPHEGGHVTGSHASASPVTDGERLIASFGSRGLYALDLEGELLWASDLGRLATKHGHGEGSSPALFAGTLVATHDHEGDSFVVALDAATGEERWRRAREEVTSWSSPMIATIDGKPQAILSGTNRIRGYDLATGAELWTCGGLSHNVVATPVVSGTRLWAASSYEKQALVALELAGARGELTGGEHVLWYRRKGTPYVPTPLLLGDALYVLHHYQGTLSRIDAATGHEPERPTRLAGVRDVYASPVSADGRLYVVDRSGLTVVLEDGPRPRVLARNELDDRFSATPALVGEVLYLRGERFLYALAREGGPPRPAR